MKLQWADGTKIRLERVGWVEDLQIEPEPSMFYDRAGRLSELYCRAKIEPNFNKYQSIK